jgi:hypothetical protein
MNSARRNIFNRLNSADKVSRVAILDKKTQSEDLSLVEKIDKLKTLMEAMRTDVYVV